METKRFLSIRVSQADYDEIHQLYKLSGFDSMTKYIKFILLNKSVPDKMFELMRLLVSIQSKLDKIDYTLNEATKEQLLQHMADIKSQTNQFYRNWPH